MTADEIAQARLLYVIRDAATRAISARQLAEWRANQSQPEHHVREALERSQQEIEVAHILMRIVDDTWGGP